MLPCYVGHVHGEKRQKKGISVTIETGMAAPDFALPDGDGNTVKLSAFRGSPVVVYFYPKDDTSGCTAEAKDFTCLAGEFKAVPAVLLGISPDSPASHRKFQEKHGLDVRLLSDEARSAAEAYGVWVEKSMYGRKYMGVERATFLIEKSGKIARVWRNVRVPGHADEVLAAVRAMKG
jgi:peroxiredoxin Q/BCP